MEIKITNKCDLKFVKYCKECEEIAEANYRSNGGTLNYLGLTKHSQNLFLAIEDGKVVGYLSIVMAESEPYVYQMAVDENYRKRGICSSLLTAAKEKYADFKCMYAHARGYNLSSHKTLLKNGFEVVGIPYSDNPQANNLYMCPLSLKLEQVNPHENKL